MNYNVPFLLGNRYSKKSGPLGTYRGDKSMFYIPTTMIAVVESGNYRVVKSGEGDCVACESYTFFSKKQEI